MGISTSIPRQFSLRHKSRLAEIYQASYLMGYFPRSKAARGVNLNSNWTLKDSDNGVKYVTDILGTVRRIRLKKKPKRFGE